MHTQNARRVNAAAARGANGRGQGRVLVMWLGLLLGLAGIGHAHAQTPAGDPPGRVARLSDAEGQVWRFSGETNEWVTAPRNRPLTSGDHIATDNGARAEITLGTTHLRLDAASELEIVQLDDQRFVVHLVGGSVAARLRTPQAVNEFELDTDDGQFRAQAAGRYRFDRLQQASDLTVYAGRAVFDGAGSELAVGAGQHAQFWLDSAGAAQYTMTPMVRDAFFAFNDDRDRAEDRTPPVRYVSPEMTGAEDLDRFGSWEQTPDYGAVWTPRGVDADWAPYRTGHWAFVQPWGWTWVDDAPWGFAPFHYGRWVRYREAWCWSPGTYVARPVYAPALVAWIGGPRVNVSVSVGNGGPPVGWFPLAPHEVYVPSYRTSETYVRNVNVTHVTNVVNITTIVNDQRSGRPDPRDFANRRFPNAVTVVPANVMTGRQPSGPGRGAVSRSARRAGARRRCQARPGDAGRSGERTAVGATARLGHDARATAADREPRAAAMPAAARMAGAPESAACRTRPIGARPPTTINGQTFPAPAAGGSLSSADDAAAGRSRHSHRSHRSGHRRRPPTPRPPSSDRRVARSAASRRCRTGRSATQSSRRRRDACGTPIPGQRDMRVNEPPPRSRAEGVGTNRRPSRREPWSRSATSNHSASPDR